MVVGLLELIFKFFRWVAYVASGRTEWLVVVQDYSHRLKEPRPAVPKQATLTPDGTPYLVRPLPGWAGENPRYRRTGRVRDHIYPSELSGIIPGYVERLPDKATAVDRAAQITQDVHAGRWPWRPDSSSE